MTHEDRVLVAYLRRSYHAVDGLWFMMTEEDTDFENALQLDMRVWRVLAKIQARKARELLGVQGEMRHDIARCFSLKLDADGHQYTVEESEDTVRFRIASCPWMELLKKSGRGQLASRVAEAICTTEGAVWSAEFGNAWSFEMPRMGCGGKEGCEMVFRREATRGRP